MLAQRKKKQMRGVHICVQGSLKHKRRFMVDMHREANNWFANGLLSRNVVWKTGAGDMSLEKWLSQIRNERKLAFVTQDTTDVTVDQHMDIMHQYKCITMHHVADRHPFLYIVDKVIKGNDVVFETDTSMDSITHVETLKTIVNECAEMLDC